MTTPTPIHADNVTDDDGCLKIAGKTLASRVIVGTGRYDTLELMRDSLDASGSSCVTVAVRREKLYDRDG